MPLLFGIGAFIVLAGVIFLAFHYESARWAIGAVVLAAGLALAAAHFLGESEEQAALALIDSSQITLQIDFSPIKPGGYTPRGYNRYRVTGRLFNDSKVHTLTELGLRVRIEDCPVADNDAQTEQTSCTVVSENNTVIETHIPPQQARDFIHAVDMPKFSPRGEPRWGWEVDFIRAE